MCMRHYVQTRATATGKARSIVDSRVYGVRSATVMRRNIDDVEPRVRRLTKFVARCCSVLTRRQGQRAWNQFDTLPSTSAVGGGVELCSRSTTMRTPAPSSRVHHRLNSLEQIQRNAGESCVSAIQPSQKKRLHQLLENGSMGTERRTLHS